MTATSSKGIIGTKLGMTQIFDQESGRVTPVTVIEAGPCPVVAVRTPDVDGYAAVQLAFRPCKEKKLSRARAGHLKAAGVVPHRTNPHLAACACRDASTPDLTRRGRVRFCKAPTLPAIAG